MDSGEESESENTIKSAMETEFQLLKSQLEEMSRSLESERAERQRLTFLLNEQRDATTPRAQEEQQTVTAELHQTTTSRTMPRLHDPRVPSFAVSQQNTSNNPATPSTGSSNENHYETTTWQAASAGRLIELPLFGGKPEEWPAFSVAYRESTLNMGYSNWQNHIRLCKSLYGPAKEVVDGLLIHPRNVPDVMIELENQYGSNDQLLRSQQDKVRQIAPITENRLDLIIPFAAKVRNLAVFIETMNSLPHLANPNTIEELVMKLPPSKRIDWGMYAIKIKPYVTIRDFSNWLSDLARVINTINVTSKPGGSYDKSVAKSTGTKPKVLLTSGTKESSTCSLCKHNHKLIDCNKFKEMKPSERWSVVKENRLCFSCLWEGHLANACRYRKRCKKSGCKSIHNILLHEENSSSETQNVLNVHQVNCAKETVSFKNTDVLFKIIPVKLYSPYETLETYAMIDDGSSVTLVDESVLHRLKIGGKEEQLTLQWFGNHSSSESSQTVDMEISAICPNAPRYKLRNVKSVKNIDLPIQTLNVSELRHSGPEISKLPIIPYDNAKPLLLIGLNNSYLGVPECQSMQKWKGPFAVKTKLGWILYGNTNQPPVNYCEYQLHINQVPETKLERLVEDFFTTESFGVKIGNLESNIDKHINNILKTTTVPVGDRFQTGLLWKNPEIVLPKSFDMARKRLLAIERKMNSSPEFKAIYMEQMNGFLSKGYARKLGEKELTTREDRIWYLPHFITSNPNKPGKHRLVFDAAAKVSGSSLNDFLHKGPDSYNSLINVLFNFRLKCVGVCADIREMFSQVLIQPSDRNAQRFLWRENGDASKPIEEYVMDVMTFGVTCSPASAHFVKNLNASRFQDTYPEAVKTITDHHYVDDMVESFDNIEQAMKISQDVKYIHQKAGFELRGFVSNVPEVADYLNGTKTTEKKKHLDLESSNSEKILGMVWDTNDDSFKFELKFNKVSKEVIDGSKRPSKREILSVIMSVFDPFGLLSNIMIHAKILIQELWRSGLDWDNQIPDDVNNKWILWRAELQKVKEVRLPRCIFHGALNNVDIQIHTFVDSSEEAFAAVTYLRISDSNNRVSVKFMAAKTRCAPIRKLLSIPRLELQSAVLGCRLASTVIDACDLAISERYFWSDSATVVSWIKSDHRKFKPFVAHRVSEILEATSTSEWNWISTKINVADLATRAKYPIKYEPNGLWINGPEFLYNDPSQWPVKQPDVMMPTSEELRPKFVHVVASPDKFISFAKFSKFVKMRRVIAWVKRFVYNTINKGNRKTGELTVGELELAEILLCKAAQQECFKNEIDLLRQRKNVNKNSALYKLSPFIGQDDLLHVNSRIRRATAVSYSAKNPVILPKDHELTNLITDYFHVKNHHQNKNAIITEIRQQYWIPNIKSAVNKVKSRCQICKNRSAVPVAPRMGELPFDRLAAHVRPFSYCGIDYFGPMDVTIGRRREKRWGVLFTCLTVRAVHLELAADLSTDACLICIRNFVNRRGVPVRIRSDNGTNFTGASKELKDAINAIDNTKIQNQLSTIKIDWVFNSPDNPEAGGAWERLIQAVKRVLSYTLFEEAPRVETLQSLLIEAESIINNRPLTDIPLTSEDDDPITPNHFIIGSANYTQTPGEEYSKSWTLKKQWRISQQLKDRFWKKWVDEFLPNLICRPKWYEEIKPLKVGDVGLIVDSSISRKYWIKGRITETYPGKDGQVRRVKIKTVNGEFTRPAIKFAALDLSGDGERIG